jgi:hypothetical protein
MSATGLGLMTLTRRVFFSKLEIGTRRKRQQYELIAGRTRVGEEIGRVSGGMRLASNQAHETATALTMDRR